MLVSCHAIQENMLLNVTYILFSILCWLFEESELKGVFSCQKFIFPLLSIGETVTSTKPSTLLLWLARDKLHSKWTHNFIIFSKKSPYITYRWAQILVNTQFSIEHEVL